MLYSWKNFVSSWSSRPNPEDRINKKQRTEKINKNDQTTEKSKTHKTKKYCFEVNIRFNLHLFGHLIFYLFGTLVLNIWSFGLFIRSSCFGLIMSLSPLFLLFFLRYWGKVTFLIRYSSCKMLSKCFYSLLRKGNIVDQVSWKLSSLVS